MKANMLKLLSRFLHTLIVYVHYCCKHIYSLTDKAFHVEKEGNFTLILKSNSVFIYPHCYIKKTQDHEKKMGFV